MELKVLDRHASNGSLPCEEARELQPDVACTCAISILWQLAVVILANAQATNSFVALHLLFQDGFHVCLHVDLGAAGMKASATRL